MNYYAVIGNPIAHSISPRLHNNAFEALGINSVYSRYLLDTSASASKLRQKFFALGLSGANITVPFKEIALECADEQDELAKKIGSANTLVLNAGKIHAFNTDAPGFMMAIAEFKNIKNEYPNISLNTDKSILLNFIFLTELLFSSLTIFDIKYQFQLRC